jgi:hypothetical protein
MGKDRTTNETAPEQCDDLPRWKEIREQRSEDEPKGKEHLDLTISEYLQILEFGKNFEEDSGNAAQEETSGECKNPYRRKKKR